MFRGDFGFIITNAFTKPMVACNSSIVSTWDAGLKKDDYIECKIRGYVHEF